MATSNSQERNFALLQHNWRISAHGGCLEHMVRVTSQLKKASLAAPSREVVWWAEGTSAYLNRTRTSAKVRKSLHY
ncbi:hypothetical protein N7453_001688 [Penicillium expansum]|nr:hypothetical protein N7453_001688 [Penicillium expansum]